MQCPDCHTFNPAQARFCMGCGRSLINGQVCRQCSTLLPVEARYCYHCGAFLAPAFDMRPQVPQSTPVSHPAFETAAPAVVASTRLTPVPVPAAIVPAATVPTATVPTATVPTGSAAPVPLAPNPELSVTRELAEMLPSLRSYLPNALYEPLERRPKERDLAAVSDHLAALLDTVETYLPGPVVTAPQPPGEPA
jgi:ribosomal protein L40E